MRRVRALLLPALTGLVLAGCGSSHTSTTASSTTSTTPTSASAPAPGQHNDQDVTFAREMIPHHRQAVEMAKMATEKASSPQVKELAAKIEQAQEPEIATMSSWLSAWGQPVPGPAMGGGGHGGHGGGSTPAMPGIMSAEQMDELMGASGAEFDRMFLQGMVAHHQGAVEMARAEQARGMYPPAKDLAAEIERAQAAEIAQMNQLLR